MPGMSEGTTSCSEKVCSQRGESIADWPQGCRHGQGQCMHARQFSSGSGSSGGSSGGAASRAADERQWEHACMHPILAAAAAARSQQPDHARLPSMGHRLPNVQPQMRSHANRLLGPRGIAGCGTRVIDRSFGRVLELLTS